MSLRIRHVLKLLCSKVQKCGAGGGKHFAAPSTKSRICQPQHQCGHKCGGQDHGLPIGGGTRSSGGNTAEAQEEVQQTA